MSWDWYIDNRIDLTDSEIEEYFRYKYRGGYYVEMKRQICKVLRSKGYTTSRIGTMLYGSPDRHDAVIHHMKSKPFHKSTEVQINWRSWIKDKVYPISSEQSKYDDKTGAYYRMEYTLKHVSELRK
jgi:arylamine N-acetyltransferase